MNAIEHLGVNDGRPFKIDPNLLAEAKEKIANILTLFYSPKEAYCALDASLMRLVEEMYSGGLPINGLKHYELLRDLRDALGTDIICKCSTENEAGHE